MSTAANEVSSMAIAPLHSLCVGDLISGSWELTQRIFENLSFREVARLRGVCKLWSDVGAKILEKRRKLHYLTVHPHNVPTTEGKIIITGIPPPQLFEKFFEHIVSKPRYCIGFCNEDWHGKADVFSSKINKGNLTLGQYLHASLPSTCDFRLVFASGIVGTVEQSYQGHMLASAHDMNKELISMFCGKDKEDDNPSKRRRLSISNEISIDGELMEEPTHDAFIKESKSNRTDGKSCVGYSIEVEARWNSSSSQAEAVSLLLIPHHPGVNLKFFNISESAFFKQYRKDEPSCDNLTITTEEFNSITSLSPTDDLKALLLFDVGLDDGFTSAFLQSGLNRQNQDVAVGGGVVECFESFENDKERVEADQINTGIAITGPNVMAASVVIPKGVYNPKALDDYMKQLKSCGLPEGQSLAFMFTCCGRGYSWYRRKGKPWFDYNNVETKAFRRFFPNTPVFGFFGGGEIGINFLPKFNKINTETEDSQSKKRKKKLFHQFTTIIVLLSFL